MYDSIVIGGGLNGLVAASTLAKSGKKVLVLEKNDYIGGLNVTRSFSKYPDVKFNLGAIYPSMIRSNPKYEEFGIEDKYGVKFADTDIAFTLLYPDDGKYLYLNGDNEYFARQIANIAGEKEADNWRHYVDVFGPLLNLIGPMLYSSAPSMDALLELLPLLGDSEDVVDLARWMLMPLDQLVDEFFDSDYVKGAVLKFGGTMGAYAFEGGTGFWGIMVLMIAGMGFIKGGTGKVTEAFAEAAKDFGAEIRLGTPVKRIIVEDGVAKGVELADGEVIESATVISAFDPKNTYFKLIGKDKLDENFTRRMDALTGSHAGFCCVHAVLDRKPDMGDRFPGIENERALKGSYILCPSKEYNDRFQQDLVSGRIPEKPVWWAFTPSAQDETLAPEGLTTLSIEAACPTEFREGDWDENIQKYADIILESYLELSPNLRGHVVDVNVQSPRDISNRDGAMHGSIYTIDQDLSKLMLFRPLPEICDGRTQFKGLYLGSQGVHPFGGASGSGGLNAAQAILDDEKAAE